ncbi:MAG: ABC transporter ATP-binding protein, partial [Tissierellia bacterium]|nr:ABC transporter ATP-binding protein [Tissierellia bacterium]
MNKLLKTEKLDSGYGGVKIIEDINLSLPQNKISVIIGANACGKSTLLKTMARLIKPIDGGVFLDGKEINTINTKLLAQNLGLLPQSGIAPGSIKVSELVARGRYPYQNLLQPLQDRDYEIIDESLELMGIKDISNRNIDELSGGQRQRVWIAMALAQQTDILLLDEPTTYLDISHQIDILDLLSDLNRKRKTTIVMVLHDINLSARYAEYIFAMKDGKLVAQG